MRRWLLIGALAGLTLTGTTAAAAKPSLRVLALTPKVIVRGVAFRPGEQVAIRLVGRTTTRVRKAATRAGVFQVALVRPAPLACGRLLVVARGTAGSSALVRIGPPECNPPGDLNR